MYSRFSLIAPKINHDAGLNQQKIRFNATGDNGRAAYFMVVRDGRFVRE